MTILHVIDSLGKGGSETLLMSYIPKLSKYNHIIVTFSKPNEFEEITKNHTFYCLHIQNKLGLIKGVYLLRRIIYNKKVSIVHAHSYWSNILSRLATPSNLKVINHYHFADYDTMARKLSVRLMVLMENLLRRKNLVRVAVSAYVEKILRKKFPASIIKLLPNFADCREIEDVKRNIVPTKLRLNIIVVGSLKSEKNYSLLIKAFAMLQHLPVFVDIYGGGDKLEYYRRTSAHLPNVTFKGNSNNVAGILKDYDLYCSTSSSETFGIALLEAVCAGLPALVSDIDAFKEVAPAGTVFFRNNDAEDFAQKLASLYETGIVVSEEAYRKVLKHFSKDIFLGELQKIYNS